MKCGELIQTLSMMKTHVQKIAPNAMMQEAVDLMDLYQVRSLPVVDAGGYLVGIISESDVAKYVFGETKEVNSSLLQHSRDAGQESVGKVMSSPVVSVSETDELEYACGLMLQHGVSRVPVVSEQSKVIGVLNRIDLLQALFEGTL